MPNLSDRATGLTNVNVISLNELSTSPSDPAAGQKRLYAKDDGKVYTLDSDGNEKEVGSGGGASVEVAQSGHGFIVGDVLYFDGTNYVKAKADAANTAEVVGIVSEVVDIDNFVATTAGYVESGLELDVDGDPLVAGSVYFLSASTAGGLTLNEPNVVGQVSRPVLLVSAARTAEGAADAKGFVLPYRGVVVGGSNARTSLSLNNNGSTNIQDMSQYDAGELSGWIYIKAGVADADSLRFYVEAQVSRNGVGDDYNISYQTSGDTPPSGFDMNVSSAGVVSVVLPDVSGFSSANINYSLNAAAVGVDLPLSLDASNIQTGTLISDVLPKSTLADATEQYLVPEYREATLNVAADPATKGVFTGGTLKIVKVGKVVTITGEDNLVSASAVAAFQSDAGLIPSWARPVAGVAVVYYSDTTKTFRVAVESDGQLGLRAITYAGSTAAISSSGVAINISYVV